MHLVCYHPYYSSLCTFWPYHPYLPFQFIINFSCFLFLYNKGREGECPYYIHVLLISISFCGHGLEC